MQVVGFFGVVALVLLMWFSGFQIAPGGTASQASSGEAGFSLPSFAPTIEPSQTDTASSEPEPEPTIAEPALVVSTVSIQAAQNIESSSALLLGSAIVGEPELGTTFFIYSYEKTDIDRSIGTATTYQAVVDQLRTGVLTKRLATGLARDKEFNTKINGLAPDTSYHARLCAEADGRLICSSAVTFTTIPRVYKPGDMRTPVIRVSSEDPINAEDVTIIATLTMRDAIDGKAYLVYGESQDQVSDAFGLEYRDIDEDDEDLQKTRIGSDIRGTQTLSKTITNLESDTQQYYIVCVEYDGLRDGVACSRMQFYRTYEEEFGEAPRITVNPVGVSAVTARLSGSVNMRDFNDGLVFFVYGTNESAVASIGGETTMTRIRQTQDRLQRVLVATDVDRSGDFAVTVRDLLPASTYSARLCVEYENQNKNYRDAQFVTCSDPTQFATQ